MEFYYNNTITSDYMNKIHMENEKSNNIRLSPRDIYRYSNLIPFLYVYSKLKENITFKFRDIIILLILKYLNCYIYYVFFIF